MSATTTYDLIGKALAKHVQSNHSGLYEQLFGTWPSDITYSDIKANDQSSGVEEGTNMASISSNEKNFVAKGMTFDPVSLADFTGVQSIADKKELEGKGEPGVFKTPDGTLYVAVQDTPDEGKAKAAIEAAMGLTFKDKAAEFEYQASGPAQGIHGTVNLKGFVVTGTVKVYQIGQDTADVIPAANMGKLEANPK